LNNAKGEITNDVSNKTTNIQDKITAMETAILAKLNE